MDTKNKAQRVGIMFIVLLLLGGIALMYKGNDAIVLATEHKEGILTAEQVKMSFDSVSGRLMHEAVKEGDFVHKGDVVMELDSIKKLRKEEESQDILKRFVQRKMSKFLEFHTVM